MRKKWKRLLAGMTAVITAGALLAGCGSNGGGTAAENGGKSAGQKSTIRFSWWGNDDRHKLTQEAIKLFEAKNPDIKIEGEPSGFGDLEEKITTQIVGGTEADVMTLLYSWISKFSPEGDAFYDIDKVSDIIDLSQLDEEFLKFGQIDGKQQAIPLGKNVLCFMVNKSAYDRLGLNIPTTWDEYKEAAKKFPEGTYLLVSPTFRFASNYYLQQVTGKTEFDEEGNLNYTEADYQAAMSWYKDLADAGVWCTRKDYLENVGTEPVSLAQNAKFIDGGYVGVFEWNGGIASNAQTLKDKGDELVIAEFPVVEGARFTGSMSKPTMLFGISKNSKSPEAAAKFLQFFLNDPEGVITLGTSRGVPESRAAVEALEADGQIDGVVKQGYDFGQTVPVLNQTPFYEDGTLIAIYMQQYENFEFGKSTLEEAAKELYSQTKAQAEKLRAN